MIEENSEKLKKKISELTKEKTELEKKTEDMAEIIEEVSKEEEKKEDKNEIKNLIGEKLKEMNEKIEGKIKQMETITANTSKAKVKKIKEIPTKPDVKKETANLMKNEISKISEFSEKLKDIDKISDLGEKVSQLSDRISQISAASTAKSGASVQGLASFGKEIDFQSEILELRKEIEDISKHLEKLEKRTDYAVSRIEERLKELDRLSVLDERYQEISEKLGVENIEKLKKIIFSSDELVDEVIPELISKKIRSKMDPILANFKDTKSIVKDLDAKVKQSENSLKNLYSFQETIKELNVEREKQLRKELDKEADFAAEMQNFKIDVKKRIDKISEKATADIAKVRDTVSSKAIEDAVKEVFASLLRPRISEIEKQHLILEEKIEDLEGMEKDMNTKIDTLEAPSNLKHWVDSRSKEIQSNLGSGIEFLKKEISGQADFISMLKEKQKGTDASISNINKRLTDQSLIINNFMSIRDEFSRRIESLDTQLDGLDEKISSKRERIAALEQESKKMEVRADLLSKDITKLQKVFSDIDEIKTSLKELSGVDRSLDKRIVENEKMPDRVKEIEKQLDELNNRHNKFVDKTASDILKFENALKQTILDRKELEERAKKERGKLSELLRELR